MSKFEEGFLIGAATAAHQVEGNNIHSDYWAQEHMEYTSFVEPSGEAVDHYHRYEEDIKTMAEAGLSAYRFSIEWARIEPEEGKFDESEIEHYRKVIKCCKENGIEPVVTMLHFTSPKWLIEKGGWGEEETITYFANYCKYVIQQLGEELTYVCTINEANMGLQIAAIMERYKKQAQAAAQRAGEAGKDDAGKSVEGSVQVGLNMQGMMERMQKQAEENIKVFGTPKPYVFVSGNTPKEDMLVIKAHLAAKKAMKEVKPDLKIGITLSCHDVQSEAGGEEAAQKEWDAEFAHYIPYIKDDDFIGVQNYTRSVYGKDGMLPAPEGAELTQMDYEFYPEALEHVIRRVNKEMPNVPIIITENGVATSDDSRRVEFIKKATDGVARCKKDGIDIKGYFYWSLLDNFEWQKGFSMTFGLISVDRTTQKRTPKESLSYLGSL
ncbi:MAG: family 1 glycosylhydrolase [Lachnospiraceae bacterium]|nr:family 1 glycosylhydrolase [Lachnospiraceae bacterium]